MQLFDCTENTAMVHMKAIRKQYKTKFVTKWHIKKYLCISFLELEASFQVKVYGDHKMALRLINIIDSDSDTETTNIETPNNWPFPPFDIEAK